MARDEDLTKVIGVLETLCEGLRASAQAQNASMNSLVEQREHVALAAKAMYKNSEVMEKAVEAFTNDIKHLSGRMDKFAETNTGMSNNMIKILAEQKVVCDHLVTIANKLDATEERFRGHDKDIADHETRLSTIEALRGQTKDSKASLISVISVTIAAGALLLTIFQPHQQTPPPPPQQRSK